MKNSSLINERKTQQNAEVTFYPMKDQIRIVIKGKVFDLESGDYVESSKLVDADDVVFNLVFGGKRQTKRFLAGKKSFRKMLPLTLLGYENCEMRS